jgi:hypothetical protein
MIRCLWHSLQGADSCVLGQRTYATDAQVNERLVEGDARMGDSRVAGRTSLPGPTSFGSHRLHVGTPGATVQCNCPGCRVGIRSLNLETDGRDGLFNFWN